MSVIREFTPWPSIARLNREIVITEKIDGTNAAVVITEDGDFYTQSRKRIIEPGDDNFGFATWAYGWSDELTEILGPGTHFGEWWGSGIQRGYGLKNGDKRFSLFNTKRWGYAPPEEWAPLHLDVVPTLDEGLFSTDRISDSLLWLEGNGSIAAPGFMKPEGIVIWHKAAGTMFKVTLEGDAAGKSHTEKRAA